MGIFDTLVAVAKCPYCGFQAERGFQTKKLMQCMETYKIGDRIENEYFMIKDVIIKNCIEKCEKCGKIFYADFSTKDGRLQKLVKVKKRRGKE